MDPSALESLIEKVQAGEVSGASLAEMQKEGSLTKSDRRKISKRVKSMTDKKSKEAEKKAEKKEANKEKAKLDTEKKKRPSMKLSKEERKEKFLRAIITDREVKSARHSVCLGCRRSGYILKNCPSKRLGEKICFNCNSKEHTLYDCPLPRDGPLKYASCFICGQQGHLSRDCPQNERGLYPDGGCCYICKKTDHLLKDCPERTEEERAEWERRKEESELGPKIGVKRKLGDSVSGGDDEIFDDIYVEDTPKRKKDRKAKKDKKDGSKKKKEKKVMSGR